MCGFAGLLCRTMNERASMEQTARMTHRLSHRGPNDHGLYVNGPVGLGHRRLSIIDLSGGHQPMASCGGRYTVVFNGEIYNHKALRGELEKTGRVFMTTSDTEVLLALYERHGEDCVRYLRGMFAFAIWDRDRRELFLGRDRVGIKPLYYAMTKRGLVFGSELKAVMASGWADAALDHAAIDDFLAHAFIRAPRTIFRDVAKLEAGSVLRAGFGADGRLNLIRRTYWTFPTMGGGATLRIGKQEALAELERRLFEAVEMRLMSEVPIGAFLSGGIDSSTVVWLMSRAQSRPVRTFSIGFDEEDFDERRYAREVAARFGTEHEEEVVTPDALEVIPKMMAGHDEPFGDPSSIPTYYLSHIARKHVTVCLSGDGGDELFGGYKRYLRLARELAWRDKMPSGLRRILGASARLGVGAHSPTRNLAERIALEGEQHYARYRAIFTPSMRRRLYAPDFYASVNFAATARLFETVDAATLSHGDPLEAIISCDFNVYLPDDVLTKVDRMSMANGLEARVPLLDHEVVEFVAALPLAYKFGGGTTKKILRDLVRPHLPQTVLGHRKQGFSVPVSDWFRGPLREMIKQVLYDGALAEAGLCRPKELHRLYRAHIDGKRDYAWQLWQLMILERWLTHTRAELTETGAR